MKLISLSVFSAFFIIATSAQAQSIHGVFRVVKGDVQIFSKDGKNTKAKVGQKVFPSDRVRAGAESRAKIVMVDNNELNISPDSEIVIENYQYKPEENKKNVLINVLYGKVRAKVEQKYDDKNKFQIKTPTAVAGVRGTDFITGFNRVERTSLVVTFEGRVEFGQIGPNGAILNPVIVKVGETTSVVGNSPPAPPIEMPKAELEQMDSRTDATKTHEPPQSSAQEQRSGPPSEANSNNENASNNNSGAPAPSAGLNPDSPDAKNDDRAAGPRMPATAGPMPGGSGSMLRPEDMPSAGVVAPPLPSVQMPPQMPNMNLPTTPTAINDIIQNQNRVLNITVTNN